MSGKKSPTPNDQRSNVKNPSSPEYWQNQGNRGKQMDPAQNPPKPGNAGKK